MEPSDWIYTKKSELELVLDDKNSIFNVGFKQNVAGLELSVTFIDQGEYYEAYVVSEPEDDDIESATYAVRQIVDALCPAYTVRVTTESQDRWAEARFEVDERRVRSL